MTEEQIAKDKTEAEAKAFIAENEPLLGRATLATLHRVVLHGGEIATRLSDEVATEMNEKARAINATADAIRDDATPPARIQELEEERMRVQSQASTKQLTFEALSDLMQRAITLRHEREAPEGSEVVFSMFNPGPVEVPIAPAQEREESESGPVLVHDGPIGSDEEKPVFTTRVKPRGFWQRLFGTSAPLRRGYSANHSDPNAKPPTGGSSTSRG